MSLQDVVSNLRAEVETSVDSKPMVKVHAKEWEKVRRETEPPRRRAAEPQQTLDALDALDALDSLAPHTPRRRLCKESRSKSTRPSAMDSKS
jgi:hypothetical protein